MNRNMIFWGFGGGWVWKSVIAVSFFTLGNGLLNLLLYLHRFFSFLIFQSKHHVYCKVLLIRNKNTQRNYFNFRIHETRSCETKNFCVTIFKMSLFLKVPYFPTWVKVFVTEWMVPSNQISTFTINRKISTHGQSSWMPRECSTVGSEGKLWHSDISIRG